MIGESRVLIPTHSNNQSGLEILLPEDWVDLEKQDYSRVVAKGFPKPHRLRSGSFRRPPGIPLSQSALATYIRSSPQTGNEARGNALHILPIALQFRREQAIF